MDKQEMIARLNKVLQDNESMACLDAQLNEAATQDGHDLATESIEFEKNVYALRKAIAFIENYNLPLPQQTLLGYPVVFTGKIKPSTWKFGAIPNELRKAFYDNEPKKQNPFYPEEKS